MNIVEEELNKKLEGKEEFYIGEMAQIKEIFQLQLKEFDELFFKETNYIKDEGLEPEWGEVCLLDTELGLKFKRIYPATNKTGEDCIRCVSYNKEEYPDFLIPMRLIRAIYRYVGMLRIK